MSTEAGTVHSAALAVRWERDGQAAAEVPVAGRAVVLAGRGRPIPALEADYPDIAVLEVSGLEGHPCVAIDAGWPWQEDTFQVYGYPREGGAVRLTPARLTYRGTHGTAPAVYLDLASDTVKPGMSGAAVLNLRSGTVCGVIVASKNAAQPDGALAVPWSAIDSDLSEVLAAGQAFHLQDQRWNTAVSASRDAVLHRGANAGTAGDPEPPEAGWEQPVLNTELVIEADLEDGSLASAVWLAGTLVCRRQSPLPGAVTHVWSALQLPGLAAADRMADAGRRLAGALLDEAAEQMVARLLNRLRPGDRVDVVLAADGPALSLPVELIRVVSEADGSVGPLGLLPGVSVSRRVATPGQGPGQRLPEAVVAGLRTAGPVKVLAAVAAPDETKPRSACVTNVERSLM